MPRLRLLVSLLCLGCVPAAAPTQRPPTATLEQGEVLRLVAALSTPVLQAPDTPLEVLEARFEQAEGPERVALAGDVVRGRVAALEGLVTRRAALEAEAADAAARAERNAARERLQPEAELEAEPEPQPEPEPETERRAPVADDPAPAEREDEGWGDADEGDDWGDEDGDDWGEEEDDDGWTDDDDDGWEDDGWNSKKRRRDRRARRRDRRARRDLARRRARRARRAAPPQPVAVEPEPVAEAPEEEASTGPAGALAALDRQITRGRVSLERLAAELPAEAPARAQAEFAVVWVAWRTESDDAAQRAAQFVEAHPRAQDLVALTWMLRAELTYEAEASLSALRFGANRLGEPVYAYSLWRAATIQRESGDAAAARESLLAVERAACESDAPSIVRELGYAAAESLEHGVRRDDDGILRPDTCPTGQEQGEGWRPAE